MALLNNAGWGTSDISIGTRPFFIVKSGQSNDNGFNTFEVSTDYISPWEGSNMWNETEFQPTTFGVNNQNRLTSTGANAVLGAHGKELSIAMRLPKEHWIVKRAQNGTALINDWFAGSDLDNQALTDLQNAWDALPSQDVIKVFEWDQWESSVSRNEASGYKTAFDELVARREAIIGAFDLIVISKCNPNSTAYTSGNVGEGDALLAVQNQIVTERANAFLLDSDDLALAADQLHYPSAEQIIRGERFVDIVLANT